MFDKYSIAVSTQKRLKKEEGLCLKPYKDTVGVLTIGFGLNLEDGITLEEAEYLLNSRALKAIDDLQSVFTIDVLEDIGNVRCSVLADMIYNLGKTRFRLFRRMINAIKKRNYEQAAHEMLESTWARQVGERAVVLAGIMLRGTEN